MPPIPKKVIVALAAIAALLLGWLAFAAWTDYARESAETPATYSDFIAAAERGEVAEAVFREDGAHVVTTDGRRLHVVLPVTDDLLKELRGHKVAMTFDDGPGGLVPGTMNILEKLAPFLVVGLLLGALLLSGGQFLGMGRATRVRPRDTRTVFADVAGVDEAKEELRETVEFLRDPRRFAMAGARVPKGILLVGPPGTGKTMLAKAAAGEAGVPVFTASGSDFVEMFVGLGAARVRNVFKTARANAPCILFIDEVDALAGKRGESNSHSEREQTLNQLLVEMDGIMGNGAEGGAVVVIAATNRAEMLDPAVTRPGRFDRHIHVGLPDVAGRESILGVHTERLRLAPDVCVRTVARGTPGFSGAELANLTNEAALSAARNGRVVITMNDFEAAKDRVLMGSERRSLALSDHERRLTACHEAGHALVSLRCPEADPIHKATIIPRGRALGMVVRLPEGDRVSVSRAKLQADIAVAMAGRAAEELVFGDAAVTTGAEADFRAATDLARRMVTAWGMSEAIGFVAHAGNDPAVVRSERTAWRIDEEVRRITDEGMERARRILTSNRSALDRISNALLERETLSGSEIFDLAAAERETEAA